MRITTTCGWCCFLLEVLSLATRLVGDAREQSRISSSPQGKASCTAVGWDSGDVYSLEVAINKTSLKFNKIKTKFGVDCRANHSNRGCKAAMIRVRRLE